ncbi:MAG: ABC transporter ATP-binding protein [Desulfomonile tiedjei]|nr:ABC transporter ATP-binding protein [Desulfomonile tiedjei]
MTPAYSVEGLEFGYGTCPVLSLDKLEVSAGEIVALVGPNGAGKTTLLHLLAFIEPPQQGRISFFGEKSTRKNLLPFRRRVGLLLQKPYLFHTTVIANILWGLNLRGISGAGAKQSALAALDRVGLMGFENRRASALSGGEAQRVALARALVLEPEVLLLDEPFTHMDQQNVQRTEEIVVHLNRDRGATVVFTTHNPSSVQHLAHRILHLFRGRLAAGSPDNLFKGELIENGTVFDTGRIKVRLLGPVKQGNCLSIDASQIVLSVNSSQTDGPNVFQGRIVALTQENDHIRVEVLAGERFQVVVRADQAEAYRIGQSVALSLDAEATCIF